MPRTPRSFQEVKNPIKLADERLTEEKKKGKMKELAHANNPCNGKIAQEKCERNAREEG